MLVGGVAAGLCIPGMSFAQTVDPASAAPGVTAGQRNPTSTSQAAGAQGAVGQTTDDTVATAAAATAAEPATRSEDIVVTGQRRSLETASQIKRQSDTIGDTIVLDEANKVPSTSLLEVLERVPGVTENTIRTSAAGSSDGFAFEGSGIQVRGLSGTKSLLNGREVFSANGGAGLSFTDIGPELLKAVTVYKASRADLIEGGIAGTIDLQTYMPFDFNGTKISGSASGNYGDFSDAVEPSASIRASTRFHTGLGEFGILADVAYSKIRSFDSNILVVPYYPTTFNGSRVYAPAGFSETDDQFERIRKGFYGALQWRPADNLTFYHTTFISEWNSNRNTQLITLTGAPSIGVTANSQFDNGVFVKGGITNSAALATGIAVASNASYTPSHSKEEDFAQGFNWKVGRFALSGSYQHTTASSGSSKYAIGLAGIGEVQTNIDTTSERPAIGFQTPFVPDATTFKPGNLAWLTSTNDGHQDSWQLDASYDVGDGFFKKLAVGGRIASRTETDNFVGTYWAATAHGWNGVPQPSVAQSPSGDFALEDFSNFFKGDLPAAASVYIPTSQVISASQFARVVNTYAACAPTLYFQCTNKATSTYLYGNPPDPNFGTQPSLVTTKPTTKSAYAMLGFATASGSYPRVSGNVGVRWVEYKTQSVGNYVFTGNATFYQNLADATASLAQIGGIGNLAAYQAAHPGARLPLTFLSVSSSSSRSGSFEQDYFLPSLNVRVDATPTLVLRYALTDTLTPPSYSDIRAQGSASVFTVTNPLGTSTTNSSLPAIFGGYNYTSGVPNLRPELSINNDVSIEWYPRKSTTLSLALFNKSISHTFLYNSFAATAGTFFTAADQPRSTPAAGGDAQFIDGPIVAKGNINAAGKATIRGIELSGRTYFDMLPGLLKGFGVDANVTYIDGKSPNALALDMNGSPLNVPLVGLSKWAYTTTLLYDLHNFSSRLSWSWRGRYLTTTSDSSTSGTYTLPGSTQVITFGLPVYGAAAGTLSGSIGYQFGRHLNVQFNVQNITNTDQRTEMEILPGRYVQRGVFVTDRRFSLSAGFNF
jgi:TonB-dependent receptor